LIQETSSVFIVINLTMDQLQSLKKQKKYF
jgi:hypothetical protein